MKVYSAVVDLCFVMLAIVLSVVKAGSILFYGDNFNKFMN